MSNHTVISRRFRFEAAHRLPNVPANHKCARLHGHSFYVTLHVGGPLHPTLRWVCDFADLEDAWKPLAAQLDHYYLNEVQGLENPTSEVLAAWIFDRLQLPQGTLLAVTVHETCVSSCTVSAQPGFYSNRVLHDMGE